MGGRLLPMFCFVEASSKTLSSMFFLQNIPKKTENGINEDVIVNEEDYDCEKEEEDLEMMKTMILILSIGCFVDTRIGCHLIFY